MSIKLTEDTCWDVQVEGDLIILLIDDYMFEMNAEQAENIGLNLFQASQDVAS